MKCEKCNLETNNGGCFAKHKKSCDKVNENLDKIIEEYKNGKSMKSIIVEYKVSFNLINRIFKKSNIHIRNKEEAPKGNGGHRHTEETKIKMSNSRKKMLKDNPEKHNWKLNNKFKSVPCENFKKKLNSMSIHYIPEMTISDDRFFSIDIALPEYKIGIEINGNQHYENDGSLKEYYQHRHDYIESLGWILHEIHYSICFDMDNMEKVINNIVNKSDKLYEFDYNQYLNDRLSKKEYKCECGKIRKYKYSKLCRDCGIKVNALSRRKIINRPSLESLEADIEKIGYCATGRKYVVSDASIRKWIKFYKKSVILG